MITMSPEKSNWLIKQNPNVVYSPETIRLFKRVRSRQINSPLFEPPKKSRFHKFREWFSGQPISTDPFSTKQFCRDLGEFGHEVGGIGAKIFSAGVSVLFLALQFALFIAFLVLIVRIILFFL